MPGDKQLWQDSVSEHLQPKATQRKYLVSGFRAGNFHGFLIFFCFRRMRVEYISLAFTKRPSVN